MRPSLGALLISSGIASEQDVLDATEEGKGTGERLGEWVIRKGLATDEVIAKVLAQQWELPYASWDDLEIDDVATHRISRVVARELAVQPIRYDGDTIVMAIAEPYAELFATVAKRIGEASYVVVSRSTLESLLGAPLNRVREEEAFDGGSEAGRAAETPENGNGYREIPADEPRDSPRTDGAMEIADPAGESGTDVGSGSPVDTALAAIDAAIEGSERLREATSMLGDTLRLTREQVVAQQGALAAAEEARERDGEVIGTLESAMAKKTELFEVLREQAATLTATLDAERAT